MAFEMSIGGFFGFLTRPFTNPVGWIMLLGAGVWIWARMSGKVGGFGKNKTKSSVGTIDYVMK